MESSLTGAAAWLQTTAGLLTTSTAVIVAIAGVYRWGSKIYCKVARIYDELTPNGGGSIKDAINRIEAMQLAGLQLTGKAHWISDPEGKCTFASTKLANLMGVHPEQVMGWGWVSSVAPQFRASVKEEWIQAVKDRREFHATYAYQHSDGKLVPVTGHAIPVIHAQTRAVVGMIGWAVPVEVAEESLYDPA